jgi:hypothetical protein
MVGYIVHSESRHGEPVFGIDCETSRAKVLFLANTPRRRSLSSAFCEAGATLAATNSIGHRTWSPRTNTKRKSMPQQPCAEFAEKERTSL